MNKSMTTLLLCAGLLAASCHTPENLLVTPTKNTDYSIINGDTVKTNVKFDVKKIKDQDPNNKSYVVVGDIIVTYKEPKLHTPPQKTQIYQKLKITMTPI